jgi:hypothetical protein
MTNILQLSMASLHHWYIVEQSYSVCGVHAKLFMLAAETTKATKLGS